MATERVHRAEEHMLNPDTVDQPLGDEDSLPPITAEDVAHAVERLEAGRESGLYERMRTSDLYVLGHLSNLGEETYEAALRDPSQLPRLLARTVTDR